mgnify:CR=1 FL=1
MCKGLVGQKLGMTSLFADNGKYVPVTVLKVGPCVVTQIKKDETDGYKALQLGFGTKKEENIIRAISEYKNRSSRFLIGEVLPIKKGILSYMGDCKSVRIVEVAGSGRWRKETVGDLDVLVCRFGATCEDRARRKGQRAHDKIRGLRARCSAEVHAFS